MRKLAILLAIMSMVVLVYQNSNQPTEQPKITEVDKIIQNPIKTSGQDKPKKWANAVTDENSKVAYVMGEEARLDHMDAVLNDNFYQKHMEEQKKDIEKRLTELSRKIEDKTATANEQSEYYEAKIILLSDLISVIQYYEDELKLSPHEKEEVMRRKQEIEGEIANYQIDINSLRGNYE